jgi:hypothetical protein
LFRVRIPYLLLIRSTPSSKVKQKAFALTGRHGWAVVSVAGDIDECAGAGGRAAHAGARVAAATRGATSWAQLEPVVAAHAARHLQARQLRPHPAWTRRNPDSVNLLRL